LVSDLLKESPDLVSQFKNFYGKSALNQEQAKSERLIRATSNDTIVQNIVDRENTFENLNEREPLLGNDCEYGVVGRDLGSVLQDVQNDPESGSVVKSRLSFYRKVSAFVVVVLVMVSLSAAAVYYDWIKLLQQ
jgi:hypothetical protein